MNNNEKNEVKEKIMFPSLEISRICTSRMLCKLSLSKKIPAVFNNFQKMIHILSFKKLENIISNEMLYGKQ